MLVAELVGSGAGTSSEATSAFRARRLPNRSSFQAATIDTAASSRNQKRKD
jgi:hypothetical protein